MTRRPPFGRTGFRSPGALVVLVVVASLVVAAVPAGAAATAGSAFVVTLSGDGDAQVTLRLPVDLGAQADEATVERVERNHSAMAKRFRDRLARVAERTASATGRSMRVSAASVDVSAGDSTATVELSATWEGLAAVEGDRLVLAEPFASGFQPAHRFVVRAPEGYAVASATPSPGGSADGAASWPAGTDLDGFRVEFAPGDEAAAGATSAGPMPGFGLVAGVAAVLVIGLLGRLALRR